MSDATSKAFEKHYDKIIDDLIADVLAKGHEAMNAMAQRHRACSKGDDRAEQLAEKWENDARAFPVAVGTIRAELHKLRAARHNTAHATA